MAKRLPRARPRATSIAEALVFDRAVEAKSSPTPAAKAVPAGEWDKRFAQFLERVMATAAVNGDPKPLQDELEKLLLEAPPGTKEVLENNRGKPPATTKG